MCPCTCRSKRELFIIVLYPVLYSCIICWLVGMYRFITNNNSYSNGYTLPAKFNVRIEHSYSSLNSLVDDYS